MLEAERLAENGRRNTSNVSHQELIVLRDVGIAFVGIRNGQITITIRDGKAVEIERITRDRPAKYV